MVDNPIILDLEINQVGEVAISLVNKLAAWIETFPYSPGFDQAGQGFFPREEDCNAWNPHSKWHLGTAIGLVDLIFLSDEIHKLTFQ